MSVILNSDSLGISTAGGAIGDGYANFSPYNCQGALSMSTFFGLSASGTNGYASSQSWSHYPYWMNCSPSNGELLNYDPNNWYVGGGLGNLYIGGVLNQNYYSDSKYKENVVEISNALDKVNSIRGVEFDWNELANEEQGKQGHEVGVIAQEVQAVYPIAVREVDKEREDHVVSALVVDYEKLIPLLLQSIKELSAEVTSLKQQVNGANI